MSAQIIISFNYNYYLYNYSNAEISGAPGVKSFVSPGIGKFDLTILTL